MFINNPQHEPDEEIKDLHDKETVHEENKKHEQELKAHENNNPNLGKGHNPIHNDIGRK